MLEGRFAWYFIAALLISGAAGAGIAYWAATAIIAASHEGDPLQKQGGLKPSQELGK